MDFGIGCELVHHSVTMVQILRAVGLMAAIIADSLIEKAVIESLDVLRLDCADRQIPTFKVSADLAIDHAVVAVVCIDLQVLRGLFEPDRLELSVRAFLLDDSVEASFLDLQARRHQIFLCHFCFLSV